MDDTTISCLAAKQLRARAKKNDPAAGLMLDNIYKIGLDLSIINDIKTCIESENHIDVSEGLYFLMGLLKKYKLQDFGNDFAKFLTKRIPIVITKNQKTQAFYFALDFYIWLKDNYSDYREKMLEFLGSNDLGCRKKALSVYETYCRPGEIEPLFQFEHDNYIAELAMCGPLIYELRDLALEKIGKLCGKSFLQNKKSEYNSEWNGNVVFYDWKPFWDWWNSKGKRSQACP